MNSKEPEYDTLYLSSRSEELPLWAIYSEYRHRDDAVYVAEIIEDHNIASFVVEFHPPRVGESNLPFFDKFDSVRGVAIICHEPREWRALIEDLVNAKRFLTVTILVASFGSRAEEVNEWVQGQCAAFRAVHGTNRDLIARTILGWPGAEVE